MQPPTLRDMSKVVILIFCLLVVIIGAAFVFHPNSPIQTGVNRIDCPNPFRIQLPVDINEVTSILYPGQVRGGDFKPHGGFRFDKSGNDIKVRAPVDSVLTEASRYIEQGEVQYLLDFQTDCGFHYRFDHILELSPKFAELPSGLPAAKENDSRTVRIKNKISVMQGEVITTAVGMRGSKNVFVDFGLYKSIGFFQNPQDNAVCWIDFLPENVARNVKNLSPADTQSGSTSAYCK